MSTHLIAVIGDTHAQIGLAVDGLEKIEKEQGRPIDQVFSVGDFGLFLDEEDWAFLTGPSKYRKPEESPKIREAWKRWRWPLSAIAGNHEPFNRLRDFQVNHFGGKLSYIDAGKLSHGLPGNLRVYGIGGIYHPQALNFEKGAKSWPKCLSLVKAGKASRSDLTYYKEEELDLMKSLPNHPQLLLMHDWPKVPERVGFAYPRRPEAELVEKLEPEFVCCGHHHEAARFRMGQTEVRALSIVTTPALWMTGRICPGWACLFEWDVAKGALKEVGFWPNRPDGQLSSRPI